MDKATPYSVTDVPKIGIDKVELAHACKAGVALAMMRSTFLFTKELAIVTHVAASAAASCTSKTTLSLPKPSSTAALKPSVAESRAGWATNWQIPIL